MRLAFVTYVNAPELTEDDKILAEYLKQKNISVTVVLWDDQEIDWLKFDAVILRSMWDYFEKPKEFDEWLNRMLAIDCLVLNPVPVVKWNQNKNYFDDFTRKGFALPPYFICTQKGISLKSVLEKNGWEKAVVKPAISGGSYNTWVTTRASTMSDEQRFRDLLLSGNVIVQKFVEEIITKGEVSLIFFDKEFSHAICKKAKAGDFRVQSQFGGTVESVQPEANIISKATEIIRSVNEPLLYGRVDGVIADNGAFLLMELELIEPNLFVATNPKACENFYTALINQLAIYNEKNKRTKA
jgi:glutathione synthase/RimK-type ligase-like ATP-grasp enzyme